MRLGAAVLACVLAAAVIASVRADDADDVVAAIEDKFWDDYVKIWSDWVRIQSISSYADKKPEMDKMANSVMSFMKEVGLENIKRLEVPDAPPYVYGDWLNAGANAPTILLYSHMDVQPPGDMKLWDTDPFEPTLKDGPSGKRMYGRGTTDDKGGVLVHLGAINAWMKVKGKLPVNVRVLFESEEEMGSPHLEEFLKDHLDEIKSDFIILTDTPNWESGLPTIVYNLRGIALLDIHVSTVDHAVHSGLFGGPVLDPIVALSKIISSMVDDQGLVAIEGFYDGIRKPEQWELDRIKELHFTEDDLRKQSGLLPGVKIAGDPNVSILEKIWFLPSLTTIAIEARDFAHSAPQILPEAKARITARIVPGQTPDTVARLIGEHARKHAPLGAHVEVVYSDTKGDPWVSVPKGASFDAAQRGLKRGFKKDPVIVGCGGSVPFVSPFQHAFGGAPTVLTGVEDPFSRIHSPNESQLMSDLLKAIEAEAFIFHEFGSLEQGDW